MYDPNAPRFTLKGVELFAAGKHRDGEDAYTEADLDEIVRAHSELDFKPPLKAGHMQQDGQPALGWIDNLRRVGTKLVGDITDVPGVVMNAIKAKAYDRVSSEIWHGLKRGGKEYRLAMKGLALLGADVPAVPGLKPLHEMQFSADAKAKEYHLDSLDGEVVMKVDANFLRQFNQRSDVMDPKELQAKIDAAVQAAVAAAEEKAKAERTALEKRFSEQREHDQAEVAKLRMKERLREINGKADACKVGALRPALAVAYSMAFDAPAEKKYSVDGKEGSAVDALDALVKVINEGAVSKLFSVSAVKGEKVERPSEGYANVGDEVDALVKKYRAENGGVQKVTYGAALEAVLDADPDLKQRYAAA